MNTILRPHPPHPLGLSNRIIGLWARMCINVHYSVHSLQYAWLQMHCHWQRLQWCRGHRRWRCVFRKFMLRTCTVHSLTSTSTADQWQLQKNAHRQKSVQFHAFVISILNAAAWKLLPKFNSMSRIMLLPFSQNSTKAITTAAMWSLRIRWTIGLPVMRPVRRCTMHIIKFCRAQTSGIIALMEFEWATTSSTLPAKCFSASAKGDENPPFSHRKQIFNHEDDDDDDALFSSAHNEHSLRWMRKEAHAYLRRAFWFVDWAL